MVTKKIPETWKITVLLAFAKEHLELRVGELRLVPFPE